MAEVAAFLGVPRVPEDPPRANMAPGQEVLTLTATGVQHMRWGLIPAGRKNARGRPVLETIVNARSETLFEKSAFAGLHRAIVPADGWYEWTGAVRRKTPHAISPQDGGLLAFAAIYDIWRAPGGRGVPQVATVTCAPSEDVRHIHDRMGLLLERKDFATWLSGPEAEASALLRPWPAGRLNVRPAGDVDWSGP
ncbi:Putative SOS response-associated peptidase YedK [Roseisalinus antarcticus]|uniref:Abasic site processing protein n=2 Tax=Roseisalinus antarcticus TaxID=254357 RepID=A0A1Y5RYB7_9RHOB|nr:Putative SOS response-associated peptidase YedK [Roseisalinus antarcticus]